MKENETVNVQHNGETVQAVNMTPSLDGDLAIVYLSTIKRLASLLPSANFNQIQLRLRNAIQETESLDEMLALIEDELKFHKTVNRIMEYTPEEANLTDGPFEHLGREENMND